MDFLFTEIARRFSLELCYEERCKTEVSRDAVNARIT